MSHSKREEDEENKEYAIYPKIVVDGTNTPFQDGFFSIFLDKVKEYRFQDENGVQKYGTERQPLCELSLSIDVLRTLFKHLQD